MLYLLGLQSWVVWLVQGGMTIWMLVDAIQSSADPYWFYIIFFFQPLGAWIYFFAIKARDFTGPGRGLSFTRAVPLEQLRYNLRSNPCIANKLALADRLLDTTDATEARPLYEEVLKSDDTQKQALFGLARAQLKATQTEAAIETLKRLLRLDASYRDYHAAEVLAQAQWQAGQQEEAIAAMDRLVRVHPRFTLMSTLARFLAEAGRKDEAREVITRALDDFRHSPRYIKRMNSGFPRTAKALLTQL